MYLSNICIYFEMIICFKQLGKIFFILKEIIKIKIVKIWTSPS
jgi:hypothetical protein